MSVEEQERADVAALARVAAGDGAALRGLVARHQAAVFRVARLLTSDRQAAEDVLQETFVGALRGAGTFRGEAAVRTWLLRIARHAAYRLRRRAGPEPVDDASLEQLGAEAGWGTALDPERLALLGEHRERLTRALEALAPEDREVLVLRDLEDLSGEETAFALGMTLAATKSRLHRARLRFAAAVRKEVGDGA